jgi:succinyl-CoA synthetase beta subunit
MLEINPLAVTKTDSLMALDAKITLDENALFKNESLIKYQDHDSILDIERKAKEIGLAYVALDGNIGCLVNGAGLAMATMDLIKHFGGEPANFLDVGGGASQEKVETAIKMILSDDKVEAIFINIFAGISKCDEVARGIIKAIQTINKEVPIVIRLEGTNANLGREIIQNENTNLIVNNDLELAAKKIIEIVAERSTS